MCQSDKKIFLKGYKKKKKHGIVHTSGRGRQRGRGKGRAAEGWGSSVRGGRGIKRAEGQEKRRTKNHSTFFLFLQLLSMMVRGKGKKKKKKMQRMGESRPWQTDVPTQITQQMINHHHQQQRVSRQGSRARVERKRRGRQTDNQQLVVGLMAACPGINEPTHPSRVVASSKE